MAGNHWFLNRPVKSGRAVGPQVPAKFYNGVDEVLAKLQVWGGHIQRNANNNWVIILDEFLDSDGTPAVASGRWKTGEGTAPVTKTCYSARIWGNDSSNRRAIDLDSWTLHYNDASNRIALDWHSHTLHGNNAGNTTMLDWYVTTDTTRNPYMQAQRGLKFNEQPARYELTRNNQTIFSDCGLYSADVILHANFGWPWATALPTGIWSTTGYAGYFSTHTSADTANTIDFKARAYMAVYSDTGADSVAAMVGEGHYSLPNDSVVTKICYANKSSIEALRATRGSNRVSLLKSDTSADIVVFSSDTTVTYGVYATGKGIRASHFDVGGNQVVESRGAAVADPSVETDPTDTFYVSYSGDSGGTYGFGSATHAKRVLRDIDDLHKAMDSVLDRLQAHGLIST